MLSMRHLRGGQGIGLPLPLGHLQKEEYPRERYILSLEPIYRLLHDRVTQLTKENIPIENLIAYAGHYLTSHTGPESYQYLTHLLQHVGRDVVEAHPDLLLDEPRRRRVVHSCVDFVGEVYPILTQLVMASIGRIDETLRLDKFIHRAVLVTIAPTDSI